ncbi:nitrate regulatory gene2 protein-like [Cucurbita maxima]|uniref:Nitrate regulatory gene2 protein-like n=1 Tax=Cucurbita maxima TaxID=3661 RepID=A0A6J1K1U4_CUCMA|nr:nitrate regulatory gene2 protein-like [Cucurbita maxima]XP_022995405.1 nitrate regulatory gene2 protein-like [Cucurbita maxima]XP_022995406.1 nitrate regulatory gene2 protein-like [Cucurbita maxima]
MGASSSKVEEDKALRLCHIRKKFVKQALHGRCSLATAHAEYIQSLRCTGTALKIFVHPEGPVESPLYTSTNATPEPLAFAEKSMSQFSFSSPSFSQRVDIGNFSPSPSPPTSSRFQANHMQFRGSFSNRVEEKLPTPVIGTVTSSDVRPSDAPQTRSFEGSSAPQDGTWDYFFPSNNHEFSFQDGNGMNNGGFEFENTGGLKHFKEEDGNSEYREREEKGSLHVGEESQHSEDEFDEPSSETLVRSFENFNRVHNDGAVNTSPTMHTVKSVASEPEFVNQGKNHSPGLSPLRTTSSVVPFTSVFGKATAKEDGIENTAVPKDLFSSMKEIESLFTKASESGKEVPRMLEANKLHIRPIFPGKENQPLSSRFLKSCFSCGDDPSVVREEPVQTATKYLTWHRTASSRSSSSRNPLGGHSKEDVEDHSSNLFGNFCMNSGSHASTLDRLYAWEKKLHDEVKANEMVRKEYDLKCKMLRHLESKEVGQPKIDKTRAVIKDLHSRIRVGLHRIDSISKKIEELRDNELHPQLEELIEGLSRMWEVMFDCHKNQLQIIKAVSYHGKMKISMQSETQRHNTIYLETELASLSSSFTKWIAAQKSYLQSINEWLLTCVSIPQKSSRGKKRPQPPSIRNYGPPPIYVTCGVWLEKSKDLPTKDVVDSIKDLAAETARFLPHQERNQVNGKGAKHLSILTSFKAENDSESMGNNLLQDEEASRSLVSGFDNFGASLIKFFENLNNFAECSMKMYGDLGNSIKDAKNRYEQGKSQKLEKE